MNIPVFKKSACFLMLVLAGNLLFAQQQDSAATAKKANKWVRSRVWAKDLKLKLHKSVNSAEFKKQYESNKDLWDKVFQFLGDEKLYTLNPGKYPIDGDNAYASVTFGLSKKIEDVKWESHRKYIDLQYVITGKVKLGVCPLYAARVTQPYNEAKDAANYTAKGKYYAATPQNFFLFFPDDVHRPDIRVKGYDTLKKLVIKIRHKQF